MIDAYSPCICGSGKRLKWCCQKAIDGIGKILAALERKQFDRAMDLLNHSKLEVGSPGYLECLKAHIQMGSGEYEQAVETLKAAMEKFPEYGMPHEQMADLLLGVGQAEVAAGFLEDALELYSPEATDQRRECFTKLAYCHQVFWRPLASWAALQRAHRLAPENPAVLERLNEFRANPYIPQFLKQGGLFKSPDELNVFNEERRKRWDECLSKDLEWRLDDLAEAFEYLSADDPFDAAAWYNLGLVQAWDGDNVAAVESLSRYVEIEQDLEQAANAWDFAELLRTAVSSVSIADSVDTVLVYKIVNPAELGKTISESACFEVGKIRDDQPVVNLLGDADALTESGAAIVGKTPRRLAQISIERNLLRVEVFSQQGSEQSREILEKACGGSIEFVGERQTPTAPWMFDIEPMAVLPKEPMDADKLTAFRAARTADFYENSWIHKNLKSLGGLTPLEAVQRPVDRRKLEGAIRFRERIVKNRGVNYDFDRLRNKLGLEIRRKATDEKQVRDISTMPVAELVKLTPSELTDDELTLAYRTANSLDAPRTALQFGEEIVLRDSLAERLDVSAIFRRIINDRIEHGYRAGLMELVARAIEYDNRHYGGEHVAELRMLEGRVRLLEGDAEAACRVFQELAEKETSNLGLLAGVVEKLLSAGIYQKAHEFAKIGYERSTTHRQKDYQEQFRDYLAASSKRL